MEVVGFKVDKVLISKWLNRNQIKDPSLDLEVVEFI